MAAKRNDPGDTSEPNLELPGFGLRRRKKKTDAQAPADVPAAAPPESTTESPTAAPEDVTDTEATPEPAPRPAREPASRPAREPASRPAREPASPPAREPVQRATPAVPPAPTTTPSTATHVEDSAAQETAQEAARRVEMQEKARRQVAQERERKDQERQRRREEKAALKEAQAADRAEHGESRLPAIDARVAAAVTGLVVGLATVTMAWLAAQGCEIVRGVGSCGGFGIVALIAILAIDVLLGAVLLTAWRLAEPLSTSFFAVGVIAVLTMLFFLDDIESRWMLLVIPLLSAAAYAIGWWVTDNLIEEEAPVPDQRDAVR